MAITKTTATATGSRYILEAITVTDANGDIGYITRYSDQTYTWAMGDLEESGFASLADCGARMRFVYEAFRSLAS